MAARNNSESATKPQRVVSLLGASTETIYRLGLEEVLVGRSHECDYPPACLKLPCISRPRMDSEKLNSSQIDSAVREFASRQEPVYKLEDSTLLDLKPDLLIAQDHCRVCAVTAQDLEGQCHNIPQLTLRPANLHDCLDDITLVANALGYPERGQALQATLKERLNRVQKLSQNQPGSTPRVALLEWCDPLMGCGYWLPELVELVGGISLFSTPPGGATLAMSLEDLLEAQPDAIVLALCGFSISRTAQEIQKTWSPQQLEQLEQVCPVLVADGNYLFNRSGPRVVESAEVLLEALYPSCRGHFGHWGSHFLMPLKEALQLETATGATKIRPPVREEEEQRASQDHSGEPPIHPPSEMVGRQLDCLRKQDWSGAFCLNSEANQQRWCNQERFLHVLESHGDFKRLLAEEPSKLADIHSKGSSSLVEVELVGGPTLIWTCVAERALEECAAVWRTEKVGFKP